MTAIFFISPDSNEARATDLDGQHYRTMKIAVAVVRMMQVAIHEIVHVVSVRNRFMPASRSVDMPGIVTAASMRGASARIGGAYFERALVVMAVMGAMHMPVV